MPRLDVTAFCSTSDLWLRRVSCDGDDGPGPREEHAEDDSVIVVLRGRFVFRDRRASTVISPRTALALRAGDSFTIEHPQGEGDVCLSIGGRRLPPLVGASDRTWAVSAAGYMLLCALVERLASRARIDRLAVEETLHLALTPQADRRTGSARDHAIAEMIAQTIDLRFDEPLTLDALAEVAGISVFHACRTFRRATSTSIHQYLQAVRLRHALALLRDTSWPLARIAVDTGFANQGHMGNVFRRRFGITPARARRMTAGQWGRASSHNL